MRKRRILVCGGRDYNNVSLVYNVLDEANAIYDIECIISGMAKGADHIAYCWAKARDIPCEEFPADWDKHKKAAGPIRNIQMLKEGKPTLVIAFPGGTGTAHMCKISEAAGVKVIKIGES